MKVSNKKIIVTGGGNGIGKEIVLNLLKKEARVIAVDMREEALLDLKKSSGERAKNLETYVLDITDKAAVEAMAKKISDVDGIINNAGIIQPFDKVNKLDYDAINRVMNVNFYGPIYMIKSFLPALLKRPEAHIVNISSMGGFLPVPGQSIYGASKAAIKLMTEGLYAELLGTHVNVTVVFPGAIETHISDNSGVKMSIDPDTAKKQKSFPMTSPQKAAEVIIDGIERNKPQVFVGRDSKLMNFLYRLNPVFATKLIAKQMESLLKD
jgi:short-subunit dehydrogenase